MTGVLDASTARTVIENGTPAWAEVGTVTMKWWGPWSVSVFEVPFFPSEERLALMSMSSTLL